MRTAEAFPSSVRRRRPIREAVCLMPTGPMRWLQRSVRNGGQSSMSHGLRSLGRVIPAGRKLWRGDVGRSVGEVPTLMEEYSDAGLGVGAAEFQLAQPRLDFRNAHEEFPQQAGAMILHHDDDGALVYGQIGVTEPIALL